MKWKCLKCGEDVSIWATVCPHCWNNPGGLMEHLYFGFLKWGIIIGILMTILGVGQENKNSISQPNKQPTKTYASQVSDTQKFHLQNEVAQQIQQTIKEEDERYNDSPEGRYNNAQEDLF